MKTTKPVTSIVMVAYNEEKIIKKIVNEYYSQVFEKLDNPGEFVVYLDGPTDNTPLILKEFEGILDIRIIHSKENSGYSTAVRNALMATGGDLIFYSDSSGKYRCRDFWKLYKIAEKFELINGGRYDRHDFLYRKIVSNIHNNFVKVFFQTPSYDFNSGFKILNRRIIDNVVKECNILPLTFSTELIVRAYKKGYSIGECDIFFENRSKGKSQFSFFNIIPKIIRQAIPYIKLRISLLKN